MKQTDRDKTWVSPLKPSPKLPATKLPNTANGQVIRRGQQTTDHKKGGKR